MENKLFFYDYIDEQTINSLYSQIDNLVSEENYSLDKSTSDTTSIGTSLLNLFKVNGKTTSNMKHNHTEKRLVTVEQRIPKIISYLCQNHLLVDITGNNDLALVENGSVYVRIEGFFTIENFNEVRRLSHGSIFKLVEFQRDPESINQEDHPTILLTSTLENNIIQMRTSLLKYRTSFHHIKDSWNYTLINNNSTLRTKLVVFGLLNKKSDNLYYIKPFSIARG
jgi:hypothetical protein